MKRNLLVIIFIMVPVMAVSQDNCAFLGPDCIGGGPGWAGYLVAALFLAGLFSLGWRHALSALLCIGIIYGSVLIVPNIWVGLGTGFVVAGIVGWLGSKWLPNDDEPE